MTQTFEMWLSTRPKWLQTAASDLLTRQTLPDNEALKPLADLCIDEVNGGTTGFSTVLAGAFDVAQTGTQVRVRRIESIEGVNALDPSAALDFGDADLVVVYGRNGTGKSGFARLTKHAAGRARSVGLLPNVFADTAPTPRASFVIERAGEASTLEWTLAGGALQALRNVHVFDVDVAQHYMNPKKPEEASYEPRRLRFLSSLVVVCEGVKENLEGRKVGLRSAMPAVPADLRSTGLATLVLSLKAGLKPEALARKLARSPDHADRMKALDEALRAQNPTTRIAVIHKRLNAFATARRTVEDVAKGLSDEKVVGLTTARASAAAAREAATQAANLAFDQAILPGVGEGAWRVMWDAARAYSTQVAYPGCSFPHIEDDSKCPLCQQVLDQLAAKRLVDFDAFVKGEIERKAKAAEAKHHTAVTALPVLPALADWLAHFSSISDAEQIARAAWAAATKRRTALAEAAATDSVPTLDLNPLLELVAAQVSSLESERDLLKKAQEGGERSKMEAELRDLRMLDWCNDNHAAILDELLRLKKLAILDRAIKTTSTRALTTKKGELAQEELTGGYQTRFKAELKALGAERIRVMPVEASKAKGKIKFKLSIVGAKTPAVPMSVLSEGEARVVTLAAFLADVSVAGARTPFIFDDPISSLDQDFEERVVARLVALAQTRQVLVFTHRISLLTLLRDAWEKAAKVAKITDGGTSVSFRQIALRRMGTKVGLATAINDKESAVHQAADIIVTKRLVIAQQHYETGSVDEYDTTMKAICSDLRILAERAVEEVLLNKVVLRFRRSVTTMNRLPHLAKISAEDCAFLDDLMTRLSVFEHSQSEELPVTVPSIDEVRADAEGLRDWTLKFKKRLVPAASAAS